ncbi:RASD1 [Branchiostoma lanceolatum]|uniref:RASD1 protein n=1 Tax=Branchiostoma lanceolatum TaxID=7740 RepID=A0A8K0AD12_BRALA|nr:RASD1 [Branchiostoma lanceolatum]
MSSHLVDECAAPPKNCFRLVVLGTARVGKTAIVSRFLFNQYDDQYTPTIEDFHRKMYRIRGEVYRLDILDTSGVHPFPAMRRLSFLTARGFSLQSHDITPAPFTDYVKVLARPAAGKSLSPGHKTGELEPFVAGLICTRRNRCH